MPRTKQPVSDKQLAANRANAARSTGPRSPEGKSRSAQNTRKHGFTATTFADVRLERLVEGICTTFLNESLTGDGKPLMEIGDALVNGDHEITMAQNRNYL